MSWSRQTARKLDETNDNIIACAAAYEALCGTRRGPSGTTSLALRTGLLGSGEILDSAAAKRIPDEFELYGCNRLPRSARRSASGETPPTARRGSGRCTACLSGTPKCSTRDSCIPGLSRPSMRRSFRDNVANWWRRPILSRRALRPCAGYPNERKGALHSQHRRCVHQINEQRWIVAVFATKNGPDPLPSLRYPTPVISNTHARRLRRIRRREALPHGRRLGYQQRRRGARPRALRGRPRRAHRLELPCACRS